MGVKVFSYFFLILSCFLVVVYSEGRTLINKEDEKKTEDQLRSWRFGAGVGSSFTTSGDSNEVTIGEPDCVSKGECGNGEKHPKKDHHEGGGGIVKGRAYGGNGHTAGVIREEDIDVGKQPRRGGNADKGGSIGKQPRRGGNANKGGSIGGNSGASNVNSSGARTPHGKIRRDTVIGISGSETVGIEGGGGNNT